MELSAFHPRLRSIYEEEKIVAEDGNVYEPFPHSLKFQEGATLYELARDFKAPVCLETGMAYGVSSLFMCQAVEEQGAGRHISVDPYQDYWNYIGVENVRRAGYETIHTYYEEKSEIQLPRLVSEGLEIDLAFVDGNHRFEYAFVDFYYMDRLLKPGGYMVLHDFHLGGIAKTVSLIARLHGDCYAFHEPLVAPVRGIHKGFRMLQSFWRAPLEPGQAVTLSGWDIPNMVVFQKYRHRPESEWGETWKYYRSF